MVKAILLTAASIFCGPAVSLAAEHELKLTAANVHWGYYDARVKPALKNAMLPKSVIQ